MNDGAPKRGETIFPASAMSERIEHWPGTSPRRVSTTFWSWPC